MKNRLYRFLDTNMEGNMFNNLEELRTEILSGKTNEEIIKQRIAYLNSKEYRNSRLNTIRRPNTSQTLFYDGFIKIVI